MSLFTTVLNQMGNADIKVFQETARNPGKNKSNH